MTDYVYRGVDHSEVGNAAEDAPNLQFDGYLTFDLGRLPHPVVGVFVNVFNDDPISRFQEIRPYVGFDWNYRPLTFSAGWNSYIFPEREGMNTQEIYGRLALDDAFLFHSSTPLLTPYVYAAYDYQKYDGVYLEAGVKHDFPVPDTGIVLTAVADLGYVANQRFFTLRNGKDTGFQHYDIGMIGTYSLNTLFNLPMRYGEWKLKGYLYYTDGLNNDLRADTQIWGGMGISFDYYGRPRDGHGLFIRRPAHLAGRGPSLGLFVGGPAGGGLGVLGSGGGGVQLVGGPGGVGQDRQVIVLHLRDPAVDQEDPPAAGREVHLELPQPELRQQGGAVGQDADEPIVRRHDRLPARFIQHLLLRGHDHTLKGHGVLRVILGPAV